MKRTVALLLFFILFCISSCKRPPLPPPVVIFDRAHGQTSTIDDTGPIGISLLKQQFLDVGFIVRPNTTPFTSKALIDIAAIVISGPLAPLSNEELQVIITYLNDGGQMCLMLENPSSVTHLLNSLNVAVANGIVHEQKNVLHKKDTDFSVHNVPNHPLTKGLTTFNIYGAWPMKTALEANIIAQTSKRSWVDLNRDNLLGKQDAIQPFSVVITGQLGHGHFVVFGDDKLLQNQYLTENNEKLGRNLARWFKEGSYY